MVPTIYHYPTLPSTNTKAKEMLLAGEREGVIVAEKQSAGRGRLGRSFFSENGLFMSVILSPERISFAPSFLTSVVAVSVCRVLRERGFDVGIKWVNDLYFEGKKVCGILCESVCLGEARSVVVGIGINVRSAEFPPELSTIAGSLCADKISLAALVAAVCGEIFAFLENPTSPHWLEEYRRHSTVLGKAVRWIENGIAREGIAESICEDGALCVRDESGAQSILRTGEISLRLMQ
jgi:BirA family biotin operon repressor/biotin-[acetyl-CoA-carboxylase] ligase